MGYLARAKTAEALKDFSGPLTVFSANQSSAEMMSDFTSFVQAQPARPAMRSTCQMRPAP